MIGANPVAGEPPATTVNAICIREEGTAGYDDKEGSGTLGTKVLSNPACNMVEVAAVSKRGRESSSGIGDTDRRQKPVLKKHRTEVHERSVSPENPAGETGRPIRVPTTRRRPNEENIVAGTQEGTQEGTLRNEERTEDTPRNENPGNVVKPKVKRKGGNPFKVTLRKPRMMEKEPDWDYVKAIRDLRVDISVGQLMTVSPITRAAFAYGSIIPSAPL